MPAEAQFVAAYDRLARGTAAFTNVEPATLQAIVEADGATLAPLRMIIGFTHNELAAAISLIDDADTKISGNYLKSIERQATPENITTRRRLAITLAVRAITAVMASEILTVPEASADSFHSKLDKSDTRDGWDSVRASADGVPYSSLLYQRFVGGAWRQVQDAYSEVKGDAILELPINTLLTEAGVPFYQAPAGAAGAQQTATRYNLNPGPDFLVPEDSPTVIIESKVAEDGGTARDKAARLKNLAVVGEQRGMAVCAVIDGKGWIERQNALVDVVLATRGRTYTLATHAQILDLPEVAVLRGTDEPSDD